MKMDNTSRLIAAGVGLVTLVLWLVLPVLSFVFVIPLFMVNGIMLATHVNQIGIFFILFPLMMMLIPLSGNKKLSIIAGALNIIICLAVFLFRKALIINGNLAWLYRSASLLISSLGSFAGVTITEANINSYIQIACDSFLMGGIGLWLSMITSIVYIAVILVFGQMVSQKPNSTFGGTGTAGGRKINSPGASAGYSHRT